MKIKNSKTVARSPQIMTTLSSEEDEREMRLMRGQKEKMHIEPLKMFAAPFDIYKVCTHADVPYTVEIRSFDKLINSCSCPDFFVNNLSTCKHIEGVLHGLRSYRKTNRKATSPLVEIFLDAKENPRVCVSWPAGFTALAEVKNVINPYFSANDTLISDPVLGLASIENAISEAGRSVQENVRISFHLKSWVDLEKRKLANKISREQFLADVKAGKRSLQMLTVPLYPYQEEGMLHLAFQGRALLADEMGLGKTIQAIAACELLRRLNGIKRVVVVSPASLKGEWEEQIAKFTGLPSLIVQGTRPDRLAAYRKDAFFFLLNYEQIRSDFREIQELLNPDVVILDEAQRIKNWQTKTAWAVKQLKAPYAFVLTGTPIENRIDEIYSIMQMVDPRILGPLFKFNQTFYAFNEKGKPVGYKNLDLLKEKLEPVLLRRLKKEVEEQLPERTVNNLFIEMDHEQSKRYQEYSDRVARLMQVMKKRPLTEEESKRLQQWLACMRMIADTPYILDEKCKICPKLDELKQILTELLSNPTNKIIIFSEWERMLLLVKEFIEKELGLPLAWHTGSVPQNIRREDIKKFKQDPGCRLFLSTDSGSTGLNLQVANVVINLDLPWNPAKLEQRIARAWRKNQTRAVQVINLVCADSIEHRMLSMLAQKKTLADGVLDGIGDLRAMALPSGRMQVLERLETMMKDPDSSVETVAESGDEKKSNRNVLEDMKDDIVAHFNDRIHLLQNFCHPEKKSPVLLALVDSSAHEIKPKIQKIAELHAASGQPFPELEVLDQETYALLQRLAKAGIITIHAEEAKTLHRSAAASRNHETEKQRRLAEANRHLGEAERKMRMAQLLASGEFVIEALPSAIEALEEGLKTNSCLNQSPSQEGILLLQSAKSKSSPSSPEEAAALMKLIQGCIQEFAESVAKFALS